MMTHNSAGSAHDCDSIRDLIPEYAFGLTSPEETRLVESNLAACPEAAADLDDYRDLQDNMRADVALFEPPAYLGDRLMAAISAPEAKPAPKPRRKIHWAWAVAAAAVLALVVTNIYWLRRVSDLQQPETAEDYSGSGAFVLTSTSSLRWVRLPPSEQTADTSAFMMWNSESEIGLLYAHGFPELAVGKTYQLWLTRGDEKVSAGTFRVDADGKGALLFHVTQPIDKFTWARITAEPASGSDQPTGNPVVVGQL
jgi:anti-sigma-K factor RskA